MTRDLAPHRSGRQGSDSEDSEDSDQDVSGDSGTSRPNLLPLSPEPRSLQWLHGTPSLHRHYNLHPDGMERRNQPWEL